MAEKNAPVRPDAKDVQDEQEEIRPEELEQQEATDLPDREAMSLVNANLAAPINAAVAANVLSDGAVAYANAEQTTPIDQSSTPKAPTLG